jgi:hypothetical protein
MAALVIYGPTVHHRFSYEPVRAACPRSLRGLFALREEFHFRWEPRASTGVPMLPAEAYAALGEDGGVWK